MQSENSKASRFKTGNEIWKLSNPARPAAYNPDELWDKACEYFQWCTDNDLYKIEYNGKDAVECEVPLKRVFTIYGLANFLNINIQTFYNYEKKSAYVDITSRIRQIIYQDKFEGASAGLYNPNIIARDLGLVDKKEVDNKNDVQVILTIPDNGRKIEKPADDLIEGEDFKLL